MSIFRLALFLPFFVMATMLHIVLILLSIAVLLIEVPLSMLERSIKGKE